MNPTGRRVEPLMRTVMRGIAIVIVAGTLGTGCAIVPRYQREAFANPAMDPSATSLETRSTNKLHDSREVAAGGDGRAAGGGCACGN